MIGNIKAVELDPLMDMEELYPETTIFICNMPINMTLADLLNLCPNRSKILGSSFPSRIRLHRL
jgi:hypothetical protein